MGEFSIWHWLAVLAIALLLFGPKRLPEIGKGIGEGLRSLKEGMKDKPENKPEPKSGAKPDEKA
jgi:sec-independent protein translocase protein TatA